MQWQPPRPHAACSLFYSYKLTNYYLCRPHYINHCFPFPSILLLQQVYKHFSISLLEIFIQRKLRNTFFLWVNEITKGLLLFGFSHNPNSFFFHKSNCYRFVATFQIFFLSIIDLRKLSKTGIHCIIHKMYLITF